MEKCKHVNCFNISFADQKDEEEEEEVKHGEAEDRFEIELD